MDRVSPALKRRRFQLGIAALCLGLAFLAGTCDNPVDLLGEMEVKAMKANDRYLVVRSINIPLEGGSFSPTGTIEIYFDRDIDIASISPDTIIITKEGLGGSRVMYPLDGVSYVASSKCVRIRVYPYLEANNDFSIRVAGVRGRDGSIIYDQVSSNFRTRAATVASITSLAGSVDSQPGYSNIRNLQLGFAVNDYYPQVKYQISYRFGEGDPIVAVSGSWGSRTATVSVPITVSGSEEGSLEVLVSIQGSSDGFGDGFAGIGDSNTIIIDQTNPIMGSITLNSGAIYTTSGVVTIQFAVAPTDDRSGIHTMGFSNDGTTWSSWVPFSSSYSGWSVLGGAGGGSTAQGDKFVRSRVRDAAGNISNTVTASINYDSIPPNPPVNVVGTPAHPPVSPTSSDATWSWQAGVGGDTTGYRIRLNDVIIGKWSTTFSTETSNLTGLPDNLYTLDIIARDAAGNWSSSSTSNSVRITSIIPWNGQAGVSRQPTFKWRSAGFGYSYTVQTNPVGAWLDVVSGLSTTQYEHTTQFPASRKITWRVVGTKTRSPTVYWPSEGGATFWTGSF